MSRKSLTLRASRPLAMTALVLAIGGALALPQSAQASAFQLHENSSQGMGRAYAGSTTAGVDCSVVVNNPAAMTMLPKSCFQVDVTGINFSTKFQGSATDAFGRPISGGNGGEAGTTLPVPAAYWATAMGDDWHLGVGFSVPFGFQTKYDRDWVGRYNAVKSKFQSLDVTLSVSYDVTDNFSMGGSMVAQRTNAELSSAINYNMVAVGLVQQGVAAGAIPPAQAPTYIQQFGALVPPGSDGLATIKGDDWAFGWQLGAFWKITPNDNLAIAYHSEIEHTLHGSAKFTMPANVQALMANPQVQALLAMAGGVPFQNTGGSAGFTTPAFTTVSYWHRGQNFGFGADVSYTQWDVFKKLQVNYTNPAQPATVERFDWRNTWYMAVGAEWYVSDKLTWRAGIARDTTPTYFDTRSPRVPDGSRDLVALGMGYQASKNIRIDLSYAHVFVADAYMDSVSATGDRVVGHSEDYGNLLSFGVQYTF